MGCGQSSYDEEERSNDEPTLVMPLTEDPEHTKEETTKPKVILPNGKSMAVKIRIIVRKEFREWFGLSKYQKWGHFVDEQMSCIILGYSHWLDYPHGNQVLIVEPEMLVSSVVSSNGRWLFAGSVKGFLIKRHLLHPGMKAVKWSAHDDRVKCLAYHPSDLLVTGSYQLVKLWNGQNHELIHTLKGHRSGVNSVDIDQTGDHVVSAGMDTHIRVWSVENGECVSVLDNETKVYSVKFIDVILVSASKDRSVRSWDQWNSVVIESVKPDLKSELDSVEFNCKGSKIACLMRDCFTIFSWPGLKELLTVEKKGRFRSGCFHPKLPDLFAVSGHPDRVVSLYDVRKGECVWSESAHFRAVPGLCFTPDGSRLISVSTDQSARVWDLSQETFLVEEET